MVSTQAQVAEALWPPDDTEESILGVDRHQPGHHQPQQQPAQPQGRHHPQAGTRPG